MKNDLIVLMISSDRKILIEGSTVRARMKEYASFCKELHIILFTTSDKEGSAQVSALGAWPIQAGTNVFIYPTRSSYKILYMQDGVGIGEQLIPELQKKSENIVITAQDPFETGWVGARLARHHKVKLNVQIHTDFLSTYFRRFFFLNIARVWIARFKVIPYAHSIRAVSGRIKNALIDRYGLPAERIVVLPIFSDRALLERGEAPLNLHAKYGQFEHILLIACRLEKEKNIPWLIEVCEPILKANPKLGLLIVGGGREQERIEGKIASLSLEAQIKIEPWVDDMVPYYKGADIFLSASLYEGYGLTLVEAFFSGLPMVTTDVGIASELASCSSEVYVCPVNDAHCFTASLERALLFVREHEKQEGRAHVVRPKSLPEQLIAPSKARYLELYKQSLEM